MIFIVTNREDYTADFLILELNRRKIDYFRFNTEDYPQIINTSWYINNCLFKGYFSTPKRKIDFNEIQSIWFRRPVFPIPDPLIVGLENRNYIIGECQSALDGIWRTIKCNWVSQPDSIRLAEDKLFQLTIASEIGFEIYPTIISNIPEEINYFYEENNKDIICKPLKRGRIVQDGKNYLIFTNKIEPEHMEIIKNVKYSHQIFQSYIHKKVELRVTVIVDVVYCVEINSQVNPKTINDWRRVESSQLSHKLHHLPSEIERKCKLLVKKLNLKFGAIDLILTPENKYIFLEINPNGQWAWIQQLCPEIPLRETLIEQLLS
ncbi:MAG: hypothetical protein C0412_16575 [Flavobacterium sp.]|nr:hypothetical protein [Flavobacterium sp.]